MTIEEQVLMLNKQLTCQNTTNLLMEDALKLKLSIVLSSLSLRIINHFVHTQLCFQSSGSGITCTIAYHIIYLNHHSKYTSSSSLTKRFVEGMLPIREEKSKNIAYSTQ